MNENEHRDVASLMVRLIPDLVEKHNHDGAVKVFAAIDGALSAIEPLSDDLRQSAEGALVEIFTLVDRLRAGRATT